MTQLRAVVFTPDDDQAERWRDECIEHVQGMDYALVAYVRDGAEAWDQVTGMISRGEAEIIIVARREHVPKDRLPRLEVVAESQASDLPQQRRARLRRRAQ